MTGGQLGVGRGENRISKKIREGVSSKRKKTSVGGACGKVEVYG